MSDLERILSPRWVDAILDWPPTLFVARLALAGAFILGGFTKLLDFPGAIAEQEHFGLHPGWLWAGFAVAIEIGGSILVLFSRSGAWFGAGALGVLTAIAAYVANDFWTMSGTARFMAMNAFFEHVGLIAGLVLTAMLSERDRRHR